MSKSPSPASIRLIVAVILIICGTVVQGISAHLESNIRALGFSTKTYTYDAFVGAFTLVVEVVMVVLRLAKRDSAVVSIAAELGVAGLLCIFWLIAGIATTVLSADGRSFCRHLNDLFDVPELEGLDPAEIATAKRILGSACSEIHAELAFIWIGFVVLSCLAIYLVALRIRRGSSITWKVSLIRLAVPEDPFRDPEGNHPGHTVGVVVSDEDSDAGRKPPSI